MGYLHIPSLYKAQDILLFRECYALEKVHGTSAHITYKRTWPNGAGTDAGAVSFSSGGAKAATFAALFHAGQLVLAFERLGHAEVTVYGEAYGGGGAAGQGMSDTYGKALQFIVFDVKVGAVDAERGWLSVPEAEAAATALGLEFVPYGRITTDLEQLDVARDSFSEVAKRRDCGYNKKREGVVLRPLKEMYGAYGRIIAKHRLEEFSERATPQKIVDAAKLAVLAQAGAIAEEWVTPMRLTHVLGALTGNASGLFVSLPLTKAHTRDVIAAMIEDVYREAKGEIVESKEAETAIGRKAAALFHARLNEGPQ